MARPLMGKELFDLLLVLPYHFTTSSFKHHKPVIHISGGLFKENHRSEVKVKGVLSSLQLQTP